MSKSELYDTGRAAMYASMRACENPELLAAMSDSVKGTASECGSNDPIVIGNAVLGGVRVGRNAI